jgi:hypothetical protein
MAVQIVMDQTGDSRHAFDPQNSEALAEAGWRFDRLTALGYTAAVRTVAGESGRITTFDAAVEETLFFPRLAGG